MNKKLIAGAFIICVALQQNPSLCSEDQKIKKQTWGEWLWSLYTPQVKKTLSELPHAATLSGAAYLTTKTFPSLAISSHGIPVISISLPLATGALIFACYANYIATSLRSLKKYNDRLREVKKAKEFLKFAISNELLYPTRSSKIHILLKQDEFLQYVNYQYRDIVNEAANQLLKEIDTAHYPEDQQTEDTKINAYISKLKVNIAHLPLETQVAELKKIEGQQKTIQEMKGYLSLYFRLVNKLEIEKGFTYKPKQHEIVPQFKPKQQEQFNIHKKQLEDVARREQLEKVIMHQKQLQQLDTEKPTKFVIPE